MRLVLLHPEVAYRPCSECVKYMYDEHGKRSERCGVPVARPPSAPLQCDTCPKIPSDAPMKAPHFAVELDARGWQAYQHHRECKAVGSFPDDAIVRRIAVAVDDATREADRMADEKRFARLTQALLAGKR